MKRRSDSGRPGRSIGSATGFRRLAATVNKADALSLRTQACQRFRLRPKPNGTTETPARVGRFLPTLRSRAWRLCSAFIPCSKRCARGGGCCGSCGCGARAVWRMSGRGRWRVRRGCRRWSLRRVSLSAGCPRARGIRASRCWPARCRSRRWRSCWQGWTRRRRRHRRRHRRHRRRRHRHPRHRHRRRRHHRQGRRRRGRRRHRHRYPHSSSRWMGWRIRGMWGGLRGWRMGRARRRCF